MRTFVVCLLFALASCGEVATDIIDAPVGPTDDGGNRDAGPDAAPTCSPACDVNATCTVTTCACNPGYTGDGLTCTMIQHWIKVGTVALPLDSGSGRGFIATGLGSRIYVGLVVDAERPQFRAIDPGTMTVSAALAVPPAGSNDFQAAGFTPVFVADASAVYLMGDYGMRYNPTSDTWATVAGYGTGAIYRGEAAGAWDSNNNAIFMIGGRTPDNTDQMTALRRDGAGTGTWSIEGGALPYAVSSAVAYAPPGDNKTYVAGGQTSDGNRRHLAVHATGTTAWTALTNAPADLDRAVGMGHFTEGGVTRVFVATTARLYFYNPAAGTWDRTVPSATTASSQQVVMAGNTAYTIAPGTGIGQADIWRLSTIAQ